MQTGQAKNSVATLKQGGRESGIELLRIVLMLVIVAHHYVVNSGVSDQINQQTVLGFRDFFLLIFGWGGKTAINCFVLITGYFMCASRITARKFFKLLGEIEFYKIVIYLIFLLSGYEAFSVKSLLKSVTPFYSVGSGFTSSYLVFFLLIPFINKLIEALTQREHGLLLLVCLGAYTAIPSFLFGTVPINYIGWFSIVYLIGAYLRLYPVYQSGSVKFWGFATLAALLLSWLSVIVLAQAGNVLGKTGLYYYEVADSNKFLAVALSVCAFLFFKNLKLGCRKGINAVAASTFGVLMIHANSDTMRQWLWRDTLNNVRAYSSDYWMVHAIASVAGVFAVCTIIDMGRKLFTNQIMRGGTKRRIRFLS